MPHASELSLYEELAALHESMLRAAEALDWDRLVELEASSAQLVGSLKSMTTDISTPPGKKRELIQKTLAMQEKIREEITVWRSDVEPLLQAFGKHAT